MKIQMTAECFPHKQLSCLPVGRWLSLFIVCLVFQIVRSNDLKKDVQILNYNHIYVSDSGSTNIPINSAVYISPGTITYNFNRITSGIKSKVSFEISSQKKVVNKYNDNTVAITFPVLTNTVDIGRIVQMFNNITAPGGLSYVGVVLLLIRMEKEYLYGWDNLG